MQNTRTALVFAAATLAAGMGFAQQTPAKPEPLSTDLLACGESGAGNTYLKACVSRHGNVILFKSPWAMEHIRVGQYFEGYSLVWYEVNGAGECTPYVDKGFEDYGWQEPYKTVQPKGPNTLPITIYRKTGRGEAELVQTFDRDGTERDLTVTMTVYNRRSTKLPWVRFARYADFDVDNTVNNDVFLSTSRSVTAWDRSSGDAVSMTNLTTSYWSEAVAFYNSNNDGQFGGCIWGCCPVDPGQPGNGSEPTDAVGIVGWDLGHMAPGSSRTMKLVYRAF